MTSDVVKAIDQAVADGVDVLNLSLGGGGNTPASPVMISLFNAAAAGVFVAASAGNMGPGTATVENTGPWVTTVAAAHGGRRISAVLTLRDGRKYKGVSIGKGVPKFVPLILGSAAAARKQVSGLTNAR
jgi:hypothetical protein